MSHRIRATRWSELSPHLDRALELTGEDRDTWIASLRRDSPDIAAELEALLASHEKLAREGFLESGTLELPGPGRSLAGQVIGAYTLRAPIGEGGMGTVWLADRSDGRFTGVAAVKLLNPGLVGREGEARFGREGSILARLRHPHIAQIIDAGVSPFGQPYLVLEHVDGERIDRYCDARELTVEDRIALFLQVLDAVAHAHGNLVVHRDIKPSNVLVAANGEVKLLDFGIAKLLESEAGGGAATALTREGAAVLTPEYAAPEQVSGEPVTTATDVYALGTLLYLLLAGRHPAGGASTPAALYQAILVGEPQRLSTAVTDTRTQTREELAESAARRNTTPQRLRHLLRGDLETIVAKALKKRPDERYPSAEALAADLRRYLEHRPVSARPDSLGYRARKFVDRNRFAVAAATIGALALVGGASVAAWSARVAAHERDRALEDLRRAEITNDFSAFLLSAAKPAGEGATARSDLFARGEELIERRFAGDPGLRLHMLLTLAERYYENGQFEAWKRTAERAYRLSRPLGERRLRALSSCLLASVHSEMGDAKDAAPLIAEGLADLALEKGALAEEARCRIAESRADYALGEGEAGIRAAERALELERSRRGPPGRELEALNTLANLYISGGRYADADRTFAELMRLFAEQGRDRTQGAAICANNWANAAQSAGQMLHGAELSERAVSLAREVDPDKGAPPHVLATFAAALSLVGRFEEAFAVADEAVTKARVGERRTDLFYTLGTATRVALEAGRPDLAEQRLTEYEGVVAKESPPPAYLLSALETLRARLSQARGDSAAAVRLARSALAKMEARAPGKPPPLPDLLTLTSALNAHGESAEARSLAQRAADMARARLGGFEHSHLLGLANLELGLAQAGVGDPAGARETLTDALTNLRASDGSDSPGARRAEAKLRDLSLPRR